MLVGGVYLFSPMFMPYHAQIVDLTWEEIPERTRWLLLAFQHGSGAQGIALALSIVIIAWIPLRRGERWARWTLPGLGFLTGLPIVCTVHGLAVSTKANVPLAPLIVGSAIFLAGTVASFWPSPQPSQSDV